MNGVAFIKMHGLGNDFVVLDARREAFDLADAAARGIADRHTGVGCDQLIIVRPARQAGTDAYMEIRNADGGEVEACGNGTRCVAALLMAESGRDRVVVETMAGRLDASLAEGGNVTVDMGLARTDWHDIPLAAACDTNHVPLAMGPLSDPVATNIGNPHATFFVADAESVDLASLGPALEHHAMFPKRANIGVAQQLSPGRLRLRVWERGVGITRACGSGAAAAMVAAARRGLTERRAEILLDGGPLRLEWRHDGHVLMTGPVATSFTGAFDPALLAAR
ncbi:MAG: diaminopimelate epimerase [Alphaproteobacteria bacterium]|nr:diaminopimelate epimerase [Alphaproteobacteria bacterium]